MPSVRVINNLRKKKKKKSQKNTKQTDTASERRAKQSKGKSKGISGKDKKSGIEARREAVKKKGGSKAQQEYYETRLRPDEKKAIREEYGPEADEKIREVSALLDRFNRRRELEKEMAIRGYPDSPETARAAQILQRGAEREKGMARLDDEDYQQAFEEAEQELGQRQIETSSQPLKQQPADQQGQEGQEPKAPAGNEAEGTSWPSFREVAGFFLGAETTGSSETAAGLKKGAFKEENRKTINTLFGDMDVAKEEYQTDEIMTGTPPITPAGAPGEIAKGAWEGWKAIPETAKTALKAIGGTGTAAAGASQMWQWLGSDNLQTSSVMYARDKANSVIFQNADPKKALEDLEQEKAFFEKVRNFTETNSIINPTLWPFRHIIVGGLNQSERMIDFHMQRIENQIEDTENEEQEGTERLRQP